MNRGCLTRLEMLVAAVHIGCARGGAQVAFTDGLDVFENNAAFHHKAMLVNPAFAGIPLLSR